MRTVYKVLEINNLTKIYGEGENKVHALEDVSFSVKKENLY